jgi:hypothetical protein
LVASEDAGFALDRMPSLLVCRLLDCPLSWDVVKFEASEVVLQPTDFLAIRGHLGVVAA